MADCQHRTPSVLPEFWTVGKVDDLKAKLRTSLQSTDIGVQACASLDDTTRAEWGLFYATSMQWAQTSTSVWLLGSQADQGQNYQDELYCRQQTLFAGGCVVPVDNPATPSALGANSPLTTTLKTVTVLAGVVAGAYLVGKVTEVAVEAMRLAPHPRQ